MNYSLFKQMFKTAENRDKLHFLPDMSLMTSLEQSSKTILQRELWTTQKAVFFFPTIPSYQHVQTKPKSLKSQDYTEYSIKNYVISLEKSKRSSIID